MCTRLQDFVYQVGNPPVAAVKTNGLYYEPGEKSYMRETIAYQVLGWDLCSMIAPPPCPPHH